MDEFCLIQITKRFSVVLGLKIASKKGCPASQLGYLKTTRTFNSVHFVRDMSFRVRVHILLLLILFIHLAKCMKLNFFTLKLIMHWFI